MRRAIGLIVLCTAGPLDVDGAELADPVGTCLLSLRSSVLKREQSPADAVADARAWAEQHAPQHAALVRLGAALSRNAPPRGLAVDLDSFISQSRTSVDACHAKTLEAKRTLDGLTHQVTALSGQMSSQSKVVETNTQSLEQAIAEKHSADDELLSALQACDARQDTTILLQYRQELEELEQLASPAVRAQLADADQMVAGVHQHVATQQAAADAAADAQVAGQSEDELLTNAQRLVNSSLLQRTWTRAECTNFASFLQRRKPPADSGVQYVELNCNETRANLQEQYEVSYAEISLLYQNSATTVADALADCKATATTEHEGKLTAVNMQIQQSTKLILAAKDLLSALEPLLDDVSLTTNKVAEHITWLEQNCHVEKALTEHLRKVRDLIDTLAACPGRNDFQLAVPNVAVP